MKISAESIDGLIQTKIPCIQYDQSAQEYDSEIMMLAATIMSASAEAIGGGVQSVANTALKAIYECAKMCLIQERKNEMMWEDDE